MSNKFKPQTPDDIDKHITAEIPDENERPNLHGVFKITWYMVHVVQCILDNKFIVPYNPELLLKFGCHINVEYTCQTSFIKYLFKYVHKGNDRVTATQYNAGDSSEATQVVDEIRNYYDCRYISPMVYSETSNVNDIVERAVSHKSIFLRWVAVNMSYPYTRSLTYAEFPTKDACFALGLLQDDRKFMDAIKEASLWASGSYVRRLFVILLTSNNISRPEHVWDRCWHVLSDDILYRQRTVMNIRDDKIKQLWLMDIDKILHSYSKTLKDYPPMVLATKVDSSLLTERVIREELNFNKDELKKNASDMLAITTLEQKYAFDKIVTAGDIVLNIASSGIASLLLSNGRTAYSRFKIPLNITEDFVCNIKPDFSQAILLLKAKLIIWDEAPMVSRYYYEALDKCFGDIIRFSPTYNKNLPFGGKVVVLGGDFRQMFPVIPRGSRQDIVHSTVNLSYL
ncbi:uncharacterized protein [Arachis hypogaea]|uniref:uncharacterized protein n=1 Tax=Arachis hypogaea TaxID=3818 RepID=UPI003B227376